MAMTKVVKSGKMTPVTGGSTKMASKGHASKRPSGITGGVNTASGKWAKGGGTGFVGKQKPSVRAKPGVSGSN